MPEVPGTSVAASADDNVAAADTAPSVSPLLPVVEKSPYILAPVVPTQVGPEGIRFDFNDGARVTFPKRTSGVWRVTLKDIDAGVILYHGDLKEGQLNSSKRYFVRIEIVVSSVAESGEMTPLFTHRYDARGKSVVVQIPVGTLGDAIAWFSYLPKFIKKTGAKVICIIDKRFFPLLVDNYPDITFMTREEFEQSEQAEESYASYRMGLFFVDPDNIWQPTDFRFVGLHRTAAYILGVDPTEERPRLALEDDRPPIAEPYVCIAVQASAQCKYWNNPNGWYQVIAFLKERGYRVVCIDRETVHGSGIVWNHIPYGVEDQTGNRPLTERARWLKHAAFFIGTSSGLAWLAWAVECEVVMISGFTHPTNEFQTPYRIINWHACNSCWNDPKHQFDHKDFLWCPRHAGTPRQFECSRLIASEQVIRAIENLVQETVPKTDEIQTHQTL